MLDAHAPDESEAPACRSVAEAARRVPSFRAGKGTHPSTIVRWIVRGIRLANGETLRLAARRYPGGWGVTDAAVDEFVDTLTADRTGATLEPLPAAPASRRRAIDCAERELTALGI
jgi:hypothetical protein